MSDPASELRDKVNSTALIIHDEFVEAGCDCEYVVGISWQRSTAASPAVRVRHAPECHIDTESEADEPEPVPAAKKATPRKPRKKAAESPADE